jgi:hypothetical protein
MLLKGDTTFHMAMAIRVADVRGYHLGSPQTLKTHPLTNGVVGTVVTFKIFVVNLRIHRHGLRCYGNTAVRYRCCCDVVDP